MDVEQAILTTVQRLGYDVPTPEQTAALESFVRGEDVLVCLPTGSGKSLWHACLPYIFDILHKKISKGEHASIAAVVSPLSASMSTPDIQIAS